MYQKEECLSLLKDPEQHEVNDKDSSTNVVVTAVVRSLSIGFDIHHIAINSDFIFMGTKGGTIEVWLKDKFTRVASIKMAGGHAKITSLASDAVSEMLFVGSSDGKI